MMSSRPGPAAQRADRSERDLARWVRGLGILIDEDLSSVRLHTGAGSALLTRLAGAAALALGNRILLSAAAWRDLEAGNAAGIELIAHEIAHVVQARRLGLGRFLWRYVAEYLSLRMKGRSHALAYRDLSAEVEARRFARQFSRVLAAGRLATGDGTVTEASDTVTT